MSEHSAETPHAHTEHSHPNSPEQKRNRRKGKAFYLGSAAMAGAVGAYELSKGLPRGMLGLVANGAHEYGDAAVRALQGLALSARFSHSQRLNKGAAGIVLAGSAVTLGQNAGELISEGPGHLLNVDPKPVFPHVVGMGGNLAAGGLALQGAKYADPKKAQHTKEHVIVDLKKAAGLLGASVTGIDAIDAAASFKFGTLESFELGKDMWRHADSPIDELDDHHAHGHEYAHDHHNHQGRIERFRERARDIGAFVAARTTTLPQAIADKINPVFIKETETGERKSRWRPIAALGAVATAATGAYIVHRFGISGSEYQPQTGNRSLSGSRNSLLNIFGKWSERVDRLSLSPRAPTPDSPTFVRLQPGSNPWEAVGDYAESLGYAQPNLQEHDAMKDIVVERLAGRDPTRLTPGFSVPMPTRGEIQGAYATY